MTLPDILMGALRAETERIETELAKYVGTGLDVGVIREVKHNVGDDNNAEVVVSLTFFPIRPGDIPPTACTIYRVSSLGGFAQA